jgi:hypothetical protein
MTGLINPDAAGRGTSAPDLSKRLFVGSGVLSDATFQKIISDIESHARTERSYLPTHKKGGAIAYDTLREKIPVIVELYLSDEMQALISRVTGVKVKPTPTTDKSSCSLLVYEEPGDHIGWHFDHNFYRGRHFTILIPIVNRNAGGSGLSAARLIAKRGDSEVVIETPPNAIIVFEGAKVCHKVVPIAAGERRVVLSMTYCTDPRNSVVQESMRRVKDTAFFGIRTLWG